MNGLIKPFIVGDIVDERKIIKINYNTYTIINKRLTDFIGYQIETIIKKKDLERLNKWNQQT